LHIIDGTEPDWTERYKAIRHEMDSYGGGLVDKPEIVVINKIDSVDDDVAQEQLKKLNAYFKRKTVMHKPSSILQISAAGMTGIKELITDIERMFTGIEK
jgi:GTP-binding protein